MDVNVYFVVLVLKAPNRKKFCGGGPPPNSVTILLSKLYVLRT